MTMATTKATHVLKRLISSGGLRRIQSWLYQLNKLRFCLVTGVQVEVLSHVDWCIYNELFADCEYDRPISCVAGMREPTLNVLDLGCNVGFFTLRLLDRFRAAGIDPQIRLWAVDPDESNLAELRRRLSGQDRQITRHLELHTLQGLVGRKNGTATFYQSHRYHASSVLKSPGLAGARGVERSYVDLDALAPSTVWDLVKCDIEGSEGDFVASYGDLLSRTRVFVVEIHPGTCDAGELRDRLRTAGLTCETVLAERAGNQVVMFTRESVF